tara:strand:+ start:816 stop:1925 length:1110 start_codon:yes stop_codon:yes gene_type:complete
MAYTTIKDPSAYFQIKKYAGTSGLNIPVTHTNDGNSDLQPDFIWFKETGSPGGYNYEHYLVDSSRGRAKGLHCDNTAAETTTAAAGNDLVSFDSDGFKVGAPSEGNSTNGGNTNKVAWQWKCNGGTTASNTDGDINSTVQVNQTAGFSIVTYTGNGSTSDQTIGHGLGVRANAVIVKNRDAAVNWVVWSEGVDANHTLELNTTDGISDSTQGRVLSNAGSRGTSTIFSIRSGGGSVVQTNTNNENYIAYCFASKQGYSKFGKYKGNSNDNGTFVYLGFKPRWLMIKSTQANMSWDIMDTVRSTTNPMDDYFTANTSDPQGTSSTKNIDFLSNGFKCRDDNNINFSDHTYIYMAFAEHPFVAGGVPTTTR